MSAEHWRNAINKLRAEEVKAARLRESMQQSATVLAEFLASEEGLVARELLKLSGQTIELADKRFDGEGAMVSHNHKLVFTDRGIGFCDADEFRPLTNRVRICYKCS